MIRTVWSRGALALTQQAWRPFVRYALPLIYAVFIGWFGIFGSLNVSQTLSHLVFDGVVQGVCLFIGCAAAVAAIGLVFMKPLVEIIGSLLLGSGIWTYVALLVLSLGSGSTPTASIACSTAFVILIGFRIIFLARRLPGQKRRGAVE